VYTIIGVDADSFSKYGGEFELKEAQKMYDEQIKPKRKYTKKTK
jgi:hypothetical protein